MRDAKGTYRSHHRVHTGGCRADGPRLADSFDPQRIDRGRRFRAGQIQTRQIRGSGQSIIHQAAGEELAVLVVNYFLVKRLSQALDDSSLDLSIDEQWIDDFAAVIHRDVFFNSDFPSLRLDFHHTDVGAEGKGEVGRLKRGFR